MVAKGVNSLTLSMLPIKTFMAILSCPASQINQLVDEYIKIADLNLITGIEDWNTPDHLLVGFGITFPSFTAALRKTRD